MTEANSLVPGVKFGGWEILSIDPTGKRACVACRCGGVHIFSAEALRDGTAACAAMPISSERAASMRAEIDEARRRRDRDWRPGDRTP